MKKFLVILILLFSADYSHAVLAQTQVQMTGAGGTPHGATGTPLQVATRSVIPNELFGGSTNANTRRYFFARSAITSLKIILPNFYVSSSGVETAVGAATTVNGALVEYPLGTCTTILFGGSASTTVPNGGMVTSDAVSVSIPLNAKFFISTNISNSAGIPLGDGDGTTAIPADTANGDAVNVLGGSLTCGAITDQGSGKTGPDPVAIIANSTNRAFALIGDSRTFGFRDAYVNSSGDLGEVARSVGPNFSYINMGAPGTAAASWTTSGNITNRKALLAFVTDKIIDYGINDLNGGTLITTIVSNEQSISTVVTTARNYLTTTSPDTTSTDSWATTTNQTIGTATAALNTAQRVATGFTGVFDIASTTDSSLNSNLWVVSPSPPYTTDGLHENSAGYLLIQSSGVVNP